MGRGAHNGGEEQASLRQFVGNPLEALADSEWFLTRAELIERCQREFHEWVMLLDAYYDREGEHSPYRTNESAVECCFEIATRFVPTSDEDIFMLMGDRLPDALDRELPRWALGMQQWSEPDLALGQSHLLYYLLLDETLDALKRTAWTRGFEIDGDWSSQVR
jgi:hypothetical protein